MVPCCSKINKPLKSIKDSFIIYKIKEENEFTYLQLKEKIYCLRDLA